MATHEKTSEPPGPYESLALSFDEIAARQPEPRRSSRGYHRLIEAVYRSIVRPGASVLEIGSGAGDLLAAVSPATGLGIDVSEGMVDLARRRHPGLRFEQGAGEDFALEETYDYILLSDLVPYVDDLLALLANAAEHATSETRVVVHSYSQLWRPALAVLEWLGLKQRTPIRNWLTIGDVKNLMQLTGLEPVTTTRRILVPLKIPVLSAFLNGIVGPLPIIRHLSLTWWIVARKRPPEEPDELSVSIVVPAKDEAGMIERIVEETPSLGSRSELIFVEGGSSDGTGEEIRRQIELHPDRQIVHLQQTGKGKGDAVRLGFEHARYEALIILDADLTVRPRELSRFLDAIATGRAEFSPTAHGSCTASSRARCATSTYWATRPSRSSSARWSASRSRTRSAARRCSSADGTRRSRPGARISATSTRSATSTCWLGAAKLQLVIV